MVGASRRIARLLVASAVLAPAALQASPNVVVHGVRTAVSDAGRRLLVFDVAAGPVGGEARRARVVGDETLPATLREAFGDAAEPVATALVGVLGPRLRARSRAERAAARHALEQAEAVTPMVFFDMRPNVSLPEAVAGRLNRIARRFFVETGRRVLVTSGTRGPHGQAAAMYTKLTRGRSLLALYRNRDAARQIQAVYSAGRRSRASRARIVSSMAEVIETQMKRGVYISRHLVSGAVDLRSRGLSRRERSSLRTAVRAETRVTVLEEQHPPHFHLTFR